jgi:hypothetical protein
MATAATAAVVFIMLTVTHVDAFGASSHRDGVESFYAAEAALEVSIDEVANLASWTPLLSGATPARWSAAMAAPVTPLAGMLNLPSMTTALQAETNAAVSLGANTPSWELFGHAPISAIWPGAGPVGEVYVVVWVADDTGDNDGSPGIDANGTIQLRAEAFGRRASRRIVEAEIARGSGGVVRLVAWREVR